KSGISTSTRHPGTRRRISVIVSAKTRAPPMLSSSRLTLVTTANFSPSFSTAAAGTQVAQQHEGRGAMVPALADVGTMRRLADGVQLQVARQGLKVVVIL